MSFRGRLTLFFVAIVVVPMVALSLAVLRLSEDSREGKSDARLSTGLRTAQVVYDRAFGRAPEEVERIANLPGVVEALEGGDSGRLESIARGQAGGSLAAVAFLDAEGERLASAGASDGIASSRRTISSGSGGPVGSLRVSMLSAAAYAAEVAELTGEEAVVVSRDRALASSIETPPRELPGRGGDAETIELADADARAAALTLEGAGSGGRLVLIAETDQGFLASEPLIAIVLLAFFVLAFVFAVLLLRMLQGQIAAMLSAARRIGAGDFSYEVPARGRDEMAGLAREFNLMRERLSDQMDQLRHQREELDQSVRRIGEAFAAGLDRTALLEIVTETALAACEATSGRIQISGSDAVLAQSGPEPDTVIERTLEAAAGEAQATRAPSEVSDAGVHSIAQPLTRPDEPTRPLGTLAIARREKPFSRSEREVLRYLMGQAAVSIENIDLHERVAEQAVTDELTGLANNRHFRDWIARETVRMQRFGGELSLILLDIDDFKRVNDVRGHLQGDAALAAIGRILLEESRGVDEAARYGGEEFVLALPKTPSEGAVEVAERIRERIEETEVEPVDGGAPVRLTASLGVATADAGIDARALLATADGALYRAKRAGKNRVEAAEGAPSS